VWTWCVVEGVNCRITGGYSTNTSGIDILLKLVYSDPAIWSKWIWLKSTE
jgi:hypothetical protein